MSLASVAITARLGRQRKPVLLDGSPVGHAATREGVDAILHTFGSHYLCGNHRHIVIETKDAFVVWDRLSGRQV